MQAWDNFLIQQSKILGPEPVQKWLRTLKVIRFDAANLYLEAKDSFQALWFEEHVRTKAKESFVNNNGRTIAIHLSITNQISFKKERKKSKTFENTKFSISFESLDPQATFSNFIVHEGNLLSHKLLCKMSGFEQKETELGAFNPIFLYGPSGVGKTHFLMAAAHALVQHNLNVRYTRAETFTEHVVSAIRAGEMSEFRKAYRTIDVLILDDIHVFSKKRATQEELFHSFNALHLSGKQILISANCSPSELQHIEPRLVSRFEWGIVLSLERPDQEALKQILKKRAESLSFPLPDKCVDFLVNTFTNNPKTLCRALDALILRSHLRTISHTTSTQLTIAHIRQHLGDLILEEQKQIITSDIIIRHVAEYFDADIDHILGKAQSRDIVLPRQIAMFICRTELKMPYTKIGDLFSRDHSTVMSGVKQVQKEIEKDKSDFAKPLLDILKLLKK